MRSNDDLTNTGFQKLFGTALVAKNSYDFLNRFRCGRFIIRNPKVSNLGMLTKSPIDIDTQVQNPLTHVRI